jgi:hypothetical protein
MHRLSSAPVLLTCRVWTSYFGGFAPLVGGMSIGKGALHIDYTKVGIEILRFLRPCFVQHPLGTGQAPAVAQNDKANDARINTVALGNTLTSPHKEL